MFSKAGVTEVIREKSGLKTLQHLKQPTEPSRRLKLKVPAELNTLCQTALYVCTRR
ncbi:hypothetical protein NQZ68_023372 [Dissostichus eleginoides]|nr:hypothetical protein NQZ68_023372 [Dissostichus eleginoides]